MGKATWRSDSRADYARRRDCGGHVALPVLRVQRSTRREHRPAARIKSSLREQCRVPRHWTHRRIWQYPAQVDDGPRHVCNRDATAGDSRDNARR